MNNIKPKLEESSKKYINIQRNLFDKSHSVSTIANELMLFHFKKNFYASNFTVNPAYSNNKNKFVENHETYT